MSLGSILDGGLGGSEDLPYRDTRNRPLLIQLTVGSVI